MAHTRCWHCYALMAEEHKGLFDYVTLMLAAPGSCGSAALKPLLAHMLGTSKPSQSAFISAQNRNHRRTHSNAHNTFPDLYSLPEQSRGTFLSKTFQKSFKGKVHPEGGITYSNLIAQNFNVLQTWLGDIIHPICN